MAPSGPEQPGTNLPAPYRSPWLVLGGDLLAVAADLRLRCRELWRRNRSGELPYPKAWPASLAASFWPLVLVGALGLLGALGLMAAGLGVLARPGALPASLPPGLISRGDPSDRSPGLAAPGADPQSQPPLPREDLSQPPAPGIPGAQSNAALATPEPAAGSLDAPPASGSQDQESPPDPNPLESWRQRPEAAGLLLQVGDEPGSSRIKLVLSDDFGQLQASQQQQRADLWLAWAQDWGYDQLELRDQRGVLLGREARVGGGMILGFSP